jgi:hypothetical protein
MRVLLSNDACYVFGELIGRIIEAYVDDIVVKSKRKGIWSPTSLRSSQGYDNTG